MFTSADIFVLSTETTNKTITIMKRFNLFLILLTLVQIAWAQKNQYIGQLDSIVVRDENVPDNYRKFEFSYTEEGKVERILYYDRNENETWSLTNKREFFYDEQGNDTLCVLSFLSNDGEWETGEKSYNTYGSDGKMLRSEWLDGLDREKGLQMGSYRDYLYDEQGHLQSTSDYSKRNGEWKKTDITHYEYDAKGCQVKVESEDLEASPKSKNVEIKRYDEKGRLTASVDSIYDGKEAREWKRCEVSYNGDWMNEVKIIIKTIDHGEKESMQDYLFDAQGNLLQARIYRRTGLVKWTHVFSETYTYDLNMEGTSIMGFDLIPKMLNLTNPLYMQAQCHHKPMQKFRIWHLDEEDDDEEEDDMSETRFYYTVF